MKLKNIFILIICILIACPIFAQNSMKDRTQNWTRTTTDTRPGTGGDNNPETGDATVIPIGSPAWALILGLGAVYGAYVFNRKRNSVK